MRLLLIAVSCIARLLPGQTVAASAPVRSVRYEITADSATLARRELAVTMSFSVAGTAPVVLALPAWSPGHYALLWFANRVSNVSAESDGVPLDWGKIDFQTWRIQPRAPGMVRLSFRYRADAIDRAVAWTAPDFAFFNGTNVFMYPVGRGFDWPATVTVHTESGWRVATGMDPAAAAANSFTAQNYHDLVDMPFYVGRFAIDSTRVSGRWFRFATYPASALTIARRDRTFGWLQKLVPQEVAVFGEAPFRNYTIFQRSDTIVNSGGLEHQSSQVDEVLTSQLDGSLAGLYAHELFHAWNVKRLRPSDLVPYRYDDAQPTRWLWVSEGVTDYYGALARVRGGVNDSSEFLNGLAGEIATIAAVPPTALSDASLSAWIGAVDGSAGLYYPKGALAGLLIDVMIRDASDNRRGIDDVLRSLYVSTYKQGRGFTPTEWWTAVRAAANGRSFTEFARRYIDGREAMPVDSVLALAALRVDRDTIREPRLGVLTSTDTTGVTVTQVNEGSAAAAAGVRVGDRIISVGAVPVTTDASFEVFRARYAGTDQAFVPVVLRRQAETITLRVPVRLVGRPRTRVAPVRAASAKATGIQRSLFHGPAAAR